MISMAVEGTIRGDFSTNVFCNIIHGSDNKEQAAREIDLWFGNGEVAEQQQLDVDLTAAKVGRNSS